MADDGPGRVAVTSYSSDSSEMETSSETVDVVHGSVSERPYTV